MHWACLNNDTFFVKTLLDFDAPLDVLDIVVL